MLLYTGGTKIRKKSKIIYPQFHIYIDFKNGEILDLFFMTPKHWGDDVHGLHFS